jgi:hypothetical protein
MPHLEDAKEEPDHDETHDTRDRHRHDDLPRLHDEVGVNVQAVEAHPLSRGDADGLPGHAKGGGSLSTSGSGGLNP